VITTHILDTGEGQPARDVAVRLEFFAEQRWCLIGEGRTDGDGRLRTLTPVGAVTPGHYRISFETDAYFAARNVEGFFPLVEVQFVVSDGAAHYHVPLLLSRFGYSTYRGS
jgi:5-hydroxyisourate hydrolase